MNVPLSPSDYQTAEPILGRIESAAIELAELGWPVFLAPPTGEKKGCFSGENTNGERWGATTDPLTIRSYCRLKPNANLGIATGQKAGIFVVDVDTLDAHGADGFASLAELEAEHGRLPMTVESASPSGGRHYFFRYPSSGAVGTFPRLVPGIDIRGAKGMVLAPPSVKPGKGEYQWVQSPFATDVAVAPDWLLKLVQAPKAKAEPPAPPPIKRADNGTREYAYGRKMLDGIVDELHGAMNGGRNDLLNIVALRMGRAIAAGWIDEGEVRSTLENACVTIGLWKEDGPKQCRDTITSGIKKGMKNPLDPLPDDDPAEGFTTVSTTMSAKDVAGSSWRRQNAWDMSAREFLYGRHLQRGKVTVTVAPGGVGKSALTNAAEALAMVTGRKLLHDAVPAPLRVWVYNLEEDRDEMNRRLEAACQHFGIEGDVEGLFVNVGFEQPLMMATPDKTGVKIDRELTDAIIAEVRNLRVDVLVVDPFVSTHQVNENDNGAIDVVAKEWARIANEANCAVHLIHHTSKLRGFEATVEHSRGAISLINAARYARALNPMTADEAAAFGIKEAWRHLRVDDGKANYAPRAEAAHWFAHTSVHLANGDNVGVVTPFTLPNATDGVTVTHLDEVMRLAGEKEGPERYREDVRAKAWIGHMIADVIGADMEDPADKKRVKASLAMWLKSGALKVVEGDDDKRMPRKFIVPGDVDPFTVDDMAVGSAPHGGAEE
ncbi:MAG: bifunctional DNA primase/polymerase [Pseudomonadota bacterium]